MPIGELLTAIEREATAEAHALRDAASAEAAHVLADATRARATDLDAAVQAYRIERTREAEGAIAAAERRWRGEVLAAHAASLDRLFVAARAALPDRLDAEVAGALLDAALAALGEASGTVRCSAAIAVTVRARVERRTGLRVVADLEESGVVIERADGVIRIAATLESILGAAWRELRQTALTEDPA